MKAYSEYFDEDGRQIKALPKKWKDASRFKVGDKILYHGNLYNDVYKDKIGIITKVHSGIGSFEGQWYNHEYECWVNESQGWLAVDFGFARPGSEMTKNGKRVPVTSIAVHLDEEGSVWERFRA